MRRAVELDPGKLDYVMALIESLERTRTGDEGANIEEAYLLAMTLLDRAAEFTDAHNKIMSEVLIRVCDFDDLARSATSGRSGAAGPKAAATPRC